MHGTIGGDDLIELAIAHLQANGYAVITSAAMNALEAQVSDKAAKVTKTRKAPAVKLAAGALNAIGKPYGSNYDPKYRMKSKPSREKYGPSTAASITSIEAMQAHIAAHWSAPAKQALAA